MENTAIPPLIEEIKDEVIAWRRYLHTHPELSFQEEKTALFIYETLQSFDNLEVLRPTKTSVMARLIGKRPGKVIAIRADIDALPIQEETSLSFSSQNPGVMHACGHDGHTAILLGTAKILSTLQDQLKGEVRFLFQHAEELAPGGAEEMVQAGVMDGVDMVIGAHLWSPLETGKIGVAAGPVMASPDTFTISITGQGGHAGLPHQTVDAIAVGAQVVSNLQHIVSRNVDPLDTLVLSITKFAGGTAMNIITGSVEIAGTVRLFNMELRPVVVDLMERVVKGITEAHGATYLFEYMEGPFPVINDNEITRLIKETVCELYGEEALVKVKPNMGAEDFSAFLRKAPGTYFFIGSGNKEKGTDYPHHHPRFDLDEDAFSKGMNMFVHATLKLLG
ncbi:M20 family metallopeptidase [Psychrobacillus lasiicapitis]|uniref:Amidohydrolase n=1 Tax=Psychrobacillus lasiicapitis TaxID=1636719 RepID=A0A544TB64_9BACI|nr:M20 family metallopeptidase [Psychrobacillus lasiicapitis]TQR14618.1 amidohydrolase [Psychrobacillus lasiicapitis]GGA30550.1 N-acyl-L-amino acid amidohydrolase [Psychrobacillus lasiicapitis]